MPSGFIKKDNLFRVAQYVYVISTSYMIITKWIAPEGTSDWFYILIVMSSHVLRIGVATPELEY